MYDLWFGCMKSMNSEMSMMETPRRARSNITFTYVSEAAAIAQSHEDEVGTRGRDCHTLAHFPVDLLFWDVSVAQAWRVHNLQRRCVSINQSINQPNN